MTKAIFLTGTGTDIGKTYAAGLITKKLADAGLRTAYFKAAMSGNERRSDGTLIPGDALHVKTASGIDQPLEEMCPYVYETAVSPHLASRLEGDPVSLDTVQKAWEHLTQNYDYITAEGSGGILCPIRWPRQRPDAPAGARIMLEDIIRMLHLPSLLIANAGLGTINDVVLTAEYMKSRDLPLKGIIFNQWHPGNLMEEDNLKMCQELTGIPVIACIEEGDHELGIDLGLLTGLYETV